MVNLVREPILIPSLDDFLDEVPNELDFSISTTAFDYAVDVIQSNDLPIRGLDRFVLFVLRHFASLGRTLGVSDASNFVLKAYTAVARTCLRQQRDSGYILNVTPIKTTNRNSTWSEDGDQSNNNFDIINFNKTLKKTFFYLSEKEQLAMLEAKNVLDAIRSNKSLNNEFCKLSEQEKLEINNFYIINFNKTLKTAFFNLLEKEKLEMLGAQNILDAICQNNTLNDVFCKLSREEKLAILNRVVRI